MQCVLRSTDILLIGGVLNAYAETLQKRKKEELEKGKKAWAGRMKSFGPEASGRRTGRHPDGSSKGWPRAVALQLV